MHKRPKENHHFAPSQAENQLMDWFDDDWLRIAKITISVMHIQGLGRIHPIIVLVEYDQWTISWLGQIDELIKEWCTRLQD